MAKRPGKASEIESQRRRAAKAPFVVAYDFGIKRNILRNLVGVGCRVRVVPATTTAQDALALNPDGVFLSNGPGDPDVGPYAGIVREPDRQEAHLRHLPGTPDPRPGARRAHLQAEVRPPRRQPAGDGSDHAARWRSRRRITASPSMWNRCKAAPQLTHVNLNDKTVEGLAHARAADLLGAVPPGIVARPARCELSVQALRQDDGGSARKANGIWRYRVSSRIRLLPSSAISHKRSGHKPAPHAQTH